MSGRQVYVGKQAGKPVGAKSSSRGGTLGVPRLVSRLVVVNSPSKAKQRDRASGREVYVGNLPWDVTWKDLKTYMQEAGEVVRADVVLTDSGRSKGYGFVEFKDAEDAELAVNSLNGAMLKGREISVRIEMDAAGGRRDLYVAESTAAVATSNRVYVGNLTYEVEWKDLKDLMRSAGSVVRADILTDPRTGRSRGCGIVEFARTEDAVRAISTLNQTEVMGRKIFIREDREPAGAWMVQGEAEGQSAGDGGMENRVFIGNLLFEVAWQDLKDFIRSQGFNVKTVDILTNSSGKSRGCALAEFYDSETATRAIDALNNTEFMGRQMHFREDREETKKIKAIR